MEIKQEDLKPETGGYKGQAMHPFGGGGTGIGELSPAAQTLKHMAEQHQHKMGGAGNYFHNQFGGHQVSVLPRII